MSKKRPLDAKSNVVVEKHLVAHLVDYIEKAGDGVYITPSVKNGTAFPPIDAIVIAEEFKKKYPFRYKKFKSEVLVGQLSKCHEILKANSPINGGPGEKDAQAILDFASGKTPAKTPESLSELPPSPALVQPSKKAKDFFAAPANNKLVTVGQMTAATAAEAAAGTAPVDKTVTDGGKTFFGSKSPFDDEDDEEAMDDETPAVPAAKPDAVNNTLRAMYNKDAVPYSAKAKKEEEKKEESKKKEKKDKDRSELPEYLQRKLAYRDLRKMGVPLDEAEKMAKKMAFNSKADKPSAVVSTVPSVSFADVGGIESILQDIRELVEYPLTHPEIYAHLGVEPPKGILLHGPPGCGKTLLAHAIAGELKVPLLKVSAPEVVSGVSGESEAKLRQLFQDAQTQAPCILFIDEIDALAPKREDAQREMEKRIVAQLLSCMDGLGNGKKKDAVAEVQDHSLNEEGEEVSVSEFAMKANETEDGVITEESGHSSTQLNKTVIVIGATNRVESLDAALRRAGRFDREIGMGIPDDDARARILKVMCRGLRVHPETDFTYLTRKTVGYVGADLSALTREAAVIAVNRIFADIALGGLGAVGRSEIEKQLMGGGESKGDKLVQLGSDRMSDGERKENAVVLGVDGDICANAHSIGPSKSEMKQRAIEQREQSYRTLKDLAAPLSPEQLEHLYITQGDFELAIGKVQPTAKREGFATIPEVGWADVGALDDLQAELDMAIVQPILDPKLFESIGLAVPAGVLLFGPPGCGKTLVAKAVANESGASFLSVKGPELLNQYVGQSEAAVRQVFKRARQCAPCVIFFDELDALCPKRGNSGNQASERVVNQLLTELDGMDDRRNVFVIAATNRPDIIDPAMLRPGRLDKLLYIALPDGDGRLSILRKHVRRTPLSTDVDLVAIAHDPRAEGYSGADMNALVREATVTSLKQVQMAKRALLSNVSKDDPNYAAVKAQADAMRVVVCQRHFMAAFAKVRASVSAETRAKYDRMNAKIAQGRSTIEEQKQIEDGSCSAAADAPMPM